jgi:hypothetical protein
MLAGHSHDQVLSAARMLQGCCAAGRQCREPSCASGSTVAAEQGNSTCNCSRREWCCLPYNGQWLACMWLMCMCGSPIQVVCQVVRPWRYQLWWFRHGWVAVLMFCIVFLHRLSCASVLLMCTPCHSLLLVTGMLHVVCLRAACGLRSTGYACYC